MDTTKKNTTRKKPCPKGTHYNRKTEKCEPIKVPVPQVPVPQVPVTQVPVPQVPVTQVPVTQVPASVKVQEPVPQAQAQSQVQAQVPMPAPQVPAAVSIKKKRNTPCPKGTRRNKKGDCVKKNPIEPANTTAAPTAALVAPVEESHDGARISKKKLEI